MPVAGMSSTGSNGGIPIIAIAVKEDEKRCLTAGMDDYCTKPFNAGQVLKTIEKWLYKSLHQQGKV
jgi:CheY-like chemotaxis protein